MLYTQFNEGPFKELILKLQDNFMGERQRRISEFEFEIMNEKLNNLNKALHVITDKIGARQNIPVEDLENFYKQFQKCEKIKDYGKLSPLVEAIKAQIERVPEKTPQTIFEEKIQSIIGKTNFLSRPPAEQVEALNRARTNTKIQNALFEYLRQDPSYLTNLAKSSPQNAVLILGSRLGYSLSDKQLAEVVYHHRQAMFIQAGSDFNTYYKEVDDLLSSTKRSLDKLMEDRPDNQARAILIQSSAFKTYDKVRSGNAAARPAGYTPAAKMERPIHQADDALRVPLDEEAKLIEQRKIQDEKQAARAKENYYEKFDISPSANEETIKAALKQARVKAVRADDREMQNHVTDAIKILTDPSLKAIYDNALQAKHRPRNK